MGRTSLLEGQQAGPASLGSAGSCCSRLDVGLADLAKTHHASARAYHYKRRRGGIREVSLSAYWAGYCSWPGARASRSGGSARWAAWRMKTLVAARRIRSSNDHA